MLARKKKVVDFPDDPDVFDWNKLYPTAASALSFSVW